MKIPDNNESDSLKLINDIMKGRNSQAKDRLESILKTKTVKRIKETLAQ